MDSKASHAKETPRVTFTITPCVCVAFRARMGDVQWVPHRKCTRLWVQFSLIFLLLYEDMFGRCAGPSVHRRCPSHFIIIQLVCHHPHHQFLQNSNVFAQARAYTAFISATNKKKVNCQLGHHSVAQTSFKLIGSWRQLLKSSTQCLARLCRLKGSAYLNVFHTPSTSRHIGWS